MAFCAGSGRARLFSLVCFGKNLGVELGFTRLLMQLFVCLGEMLMLLPSDAQRLLILVGCRPIMLTLLCLDVRGGMGVFTGSEM
jgi:hypothetical protein